MGYAPGSLKQILIERALSWSYGSGDPNPLSMAYFVQRRSFIGNSGRVEIAYSGGQVFRRAHE
jgi:hypothetical protein